MKVNTLWEDIVLKTVTEISNNSFLTYLFIFISAVLQVIFPPYPGDVVITAAGYLSSLNTILDLKHINLVLIAFFVFMGTFISSLMVFYLGYTKGSMVFNSKYILKYFPLHKYDIIKKLVDKYGIFSIIISKFIPGIYTLVVLLIGSFRYNKTKSYIAIILTSIIHNSFLLYLGTKIGNNSRLIKQILFKYYISILLIIISIIIILVLYKFLRKVIKIGGGKNE